MKKLNKLGVDLLTNSEAGQLVKRNLADFEKADVDVNADVNIKNYTLQMQADTTLFDTAQLQNHKNGEAQVLEQLDRSRDIAFSVFNRQLSVHELSDVPAEVAAHKALKMVFANYRNLPNLNYEFETNEINHLIQELETSGNAVHIQTLNLGNFVDRLRTTNAEFSDRFSKRSTDTAATTNYDVKTIRRTMLQNYRAFANYVVSLANATKTPYYNDIVEIINTNRKYYSDTLARREGIKKATAVDPGTNDAGTD